MEVSARDLLWVVRTVMKAARSRSLSGMSSEGALECYTSWVLVLDDPWWSHTSQSDYPTTCLWEVTWLGGPNSADVRITGIEQWSAGQRMANPPVARFYTDPPSCWHQEFNDIGAERIMNLLRSGQWFGDRRLAEQELRTHLTEYSV